MVTLFILPSINVRSFLEEQQLPKAELVQLKTSDFCKLSSISMLTSSLVCVAKIEFAIPQTEGVTQQSSLPLNCFWNKRDRRLRLLRAHFQAI